MTTVFKRQDSAYNNNDDNFLIYSCEKTAVGRISCIAKLLILCADINLCSTLLVPNSSQN